MFRGPFHSSCSTIQAFVALLLFLTITTPTIAFTTITTSTTAKTTPYANSNYDANYDSNYDSIVLFSSSTPSTATPEGSQKPDLVDQTLFRAAIDRINDEIEAQYKAQKIAEGTATEDPTDEEEEWLAEQARAKQIEQNDTDFVYLVGKLDVVLPIDTQPELDLTESVGPLVLVTNVWGKTAEATGMQEFDTLTRVGVDDPDRPFCARTKCTTLEETAGALTAAAQHAIALGKTEINLEVQRLIKGYYAPEDSV